MKAGQPREDDEERLPLVDRAAPRATQARRRGGAQGALQPLDAAPPLRRRRVRLACGCCALSVAALGAPRLLARLALAPELATRITLVTFAAGSYADAFLPDRDGWPASPREAVAALEENWRCYAALHGYALFVERADWGAFPPGDAGLSGAALAHWSAKPGADPARLRLPPVYRPYWMKALLLERYLPHADWVLWLDADALFLALPAQLEGVLARATTATTDLVVFGNAGGGRPAGEMRDTLCACVFALRRSAGGRWFARRWWALRGRTATWGRTGGDQGAFQHAVVEMNMRHAAALAAGAGAGAWHSVGYDAVVSPCLPAHWTLATQPAQELDCLARVLARLERAGLPRLDERSAWPVAWSTELAGQFQTVRIPGRGAGWGRNLTRDWPEVERVVGERVRRHGVAPELARGHPRLLAHSKTGRQSPLMTLYARGALRSLAQACPAALACAEPGAFVAGALLGAGPQPYALPAVPPDASCLRGRAADASVLGASRVLAAARMLRRYVRRRFWARPTGAAAGPAGAAG